MGDMEREEALTLKERPRPPLASPVSEQAGGGRGGVGEALRSRQGLSRILPWAPSTAIRGERSTCPSLAPTDVFRKT